MPRLSLLWILALGFVGACKPGLEPGQINCDTEIEYQGRVVEGRVSGGKFAAEGKTKIDAVRQIDEVVERYLTRWRGMCREYNAGIYSKEEYRVESRAMREKMEQLDALLIKLENAPDSAAYQAVLTTMYQALVPEPEQTTFDLKFSVTAQRPGETAAAVINQGARLPTGTKVAFSLQTSKPAYVYLYQESPSGEVVVLFPAEWSKVSNPLPGGTSLQIPPPPGSFKLNAEDIGTETVHIVASQGPLADLEAVLKGEKVSPQAAACSSRGLEYDAGEPQEACSQSRGLEYDDGGGEATSLHAATELGGDRIVQSFSFDHTPN